MNLWHGPTAANHHVWRGSNYGSSYGGSTTSILVNIPGRGLFHDERGLDGYRWPNKGGRKAALATAAIGSFFAGTFAAVLLMFLAMPISALGMKFGAPEYFAIMFAGFDHGWQPGYRFSPQGALYGAFWGLLLATVGADTQTAQIRFHLRLERPGDGISFHCGRHRDVWCDRRYGGIGTNLADRNSNRRETRLRVRDYGLAGVN